MIEVVSNQLSADGMRFVKVVSDRAVSEAWLLSLVPGAAREFAVMHSYPTAALSLFFGEVTWPCREVVQYQVPGDRSRVRKLVCWKIVPSEGYHVSEIVEFLAEWFFEKAHRLPQFVFVRRLPKGIENCTEVGKVMLLEADWALDGCIMLGG